MRDLEVVATIYCLLCKQEIGRIYDNGASEFDCEAEPKCPKCNNFQVFFFPTIKWKPGFRREQKQRVLDGKPLWKRKVKKELKE